MCRALLDSGSGQSYVSEEHARKLDIKPCREECCVIGTGQCPVYNRKMVSDKIQDTVCKAKCQCFISCTKCTPRDSKRKLQTSSRHFVFRHFSERHYGGKEYAYIKMGNSREGKESEPIAEEAALGLTLMVYLGESREHKTNINLAIDKKHLFKKTQKDHET